MELSVSKLSTELLEDWLTYFDGDAFSDNEDWCGCYCMCYHWDKALQKERSWNCGRDCAAFNREQAVRLIQAGRMQGYLAYNGCRVVGWCNANDKKAYENVNFDIPGIPDDGAKTKSVVCFSVAPEFRGCGIASRLLDAVCADAKNEGFAYVEAYPFLHNEYHAYHGPLALYQSRGFEYVHEIEGCAVYRKKL